jgi:N-acetylneuraminate synthase
MSPTDFAIDGRSIGPGHPPYVIAELSANHGGDLDVALRLVDAAKAAGADAVKLQTYRPDTITLKSDRPEFRIERGPWAGRTLWDLYEWAHTPWEWHEALFARARAAGITIFSSPFDPTAVDFLSDLGAPAFKVASFEAVDLPLIRAIAARGKPMIVSTGMADAQEIGEAVGACREAGDPPLALLHCVSGYPAPAADCNLRTLQDLATRFGVTVGLSDHTLGNAVAISAVALGASIIEKHVTLNRAGGGPDDSFSLEPPELAALCAGVREAWEALGTVDYGRKSSERDNALFRRSLYFVRDLAAGETVTPDAVRSVRPGCGAPPKMLDQILGRRVTGPVAANTPVRVDLLE